MVHNPFDIQLWCHVEFSEHLKEDPAIPLELIVLPSNGTAANLKTKFSVHGSDPIKVMTSMVIGCGFHQ